MRARDEHSPDESALARAFDFALGRTSPKDGQPAEAWVAYAHGVVAARRRMQDSPTCPTAVLRRVQGLFAKRRKGAVAAVLELVFDSWAEAAPALRGARQPRLLRFEGGAGAVDVQIATTESGATRLHLAVVSDRPGLEAMVKAPPARRGRRIVLDEDGVGHIELEGSVHEAVVEIREGRRPLFRTPRVPLD